MAAGEKCAAAAASRAAGRRNKRCLAAYKIHLLGPPSNYDRLTGCHSGGGYSTSSLLIAPLAGGQRWMEPPIGHWPLAKVRCVHQLSGSSILGTESQCEC